MPFFVTLGRGWLSAILCKFDKELLNAEIRDVNSLQIIDTVLLKTYLQSSPSMISSLLRLKENFCLYNECEKLLTKSNKIPELVLLMKKANKAGFQNLHVQLLRVVPSISKTILSI